MRYKQENTIRAKVDEMERELNKRIWRDAAELERRQQRRDQPQQGQGRAAAPPPQQQQEQG